ncbi:1,2-phenylacetyl-CoA epoxidase subunit PaaC, partial [Pseudomonas sp. P7758]
LVEQPNGDYAVTILKQFLYDAWHLPVLSGLAQSSDERIAGIAAKAVKEVTYHLRRSGEWVERLGDGTEESHKRMLAAIPELWRFTVELTSADDSEQRLHAAGITPDAAQVAAAWQTQVSEIFTSATLPLPPAASYFYLDARRGLHSEHLGILLAEMQFLPRAYPDATW